MRLTTGPGVGVLALLAMLPPTAHADGFNTCVIPQTGITMRSGVERPVSPAFKAVCIAVLPPTCRQQPCAYRNCLVMDNLRRCPDGTPPAFTAVEITPYYAKPLRLFTQAERDTMNHAIDAEAQRLADQWTNHGRVPLSPGALTVLRNMSCTLHAFGNPDVQCVAK